MGETLNYHRRPEDFINEGDKLVQVFREDEGKEGDRGHTLARRAIERYQRAIQHYQEEGASATKLFGCYHKIFSVACEAFRQSASQAREGFYQYLERSFGELEKLVQGVQEEAQRSPYAGSRSAADQIKEIFQVEIRPEMERVKEVRMPRLNRP